MKKIGKTIKFIRERKGLSTSDLAGKMNDIDCRYLISKNDIEEIENEDKVNKEFLFDVCKALDTSIYFMFVLSEDPKNIPLYKRWIFRILKRIVLFLI